MKLEGEELERYLETEREKEKNRQGTEAADRRYAMKSQLYNFIRVF